MLNGSWGWAGLDCVVAELCAVARAMDASMKLRVMNSVARSRDNVKDIVNNDAAVMANSGDGAGIVVVMMQAT